METDNVAASGVNSKVYTIQSHIIKFSNRIRGDAGGTVGCAGIRGPTFSDLGAS